MTSLSIGNLDQGCNPKTRSYIYINLSFYFSTLNQPLLCFTRVLIRPMYFQIELKFYQYRVYRNIPRWIHFSRRREGQKQRERFVQTYVDQSWTYLTLLQIYNQSVIFLNAAKLFRSITTRFHTDRGWRFRAASVELSSCVFVRTFLAIFVPPAHSWSGSRVLEYTLSN